jgi:hypothetical protein
MTPWHRAISVLRRLINRTRSESELDAELRAFVDLSASASVRAGVPPLEARRRAMLELGGWSA